MEENKNLQDDEIEYELEVWRKKSRKILSTLAIEFGILLFVGIILFLGHKMS